MNEDERALRFTYHKPKEYQVEKYENFRSTAFEISKYLDLISPPNSRERGLAQIKLEEMVFWVNAAIARRG